MNGPFTGRHMAAILFAGFGIVFAVNFSMATVATRGFGGVVVENSYVASQRYNAWLEEAERQRETGWDAAISRDPRGHLLVTTDSAPASVTLDAVARHPLGHQPDRALAFTRVDDNRLRSMQPLGAGRWIVRLHLAGGGKERVIEAAVE